MRTMLSLLMTFMALTPICVRAEGLLHQLPEDGAWVRFETEGQGIAPDGTVQITTTGSLTMSSVGRATVEGMDCRWIELSAKMSFQRDGRNSELTTIHKLLIPEEHLAPGKKPLEHVVKAWRQDSRIGGGAPQELDLKGQGAREVQGMDEILHGRLPDVTPVAVRKIDSPLGKLSCEGFRAAQVETTGQNSVQFDTETWLHADAPFGVVAFRYEKERKRDEQSRGKRTMTFNLVGVGDDAQSALPDAN